MKVKFKMTLTELNEVVLNVGNLPFGNIAMTDVEFINLKEFYFFGVQKFSREMLNNRNKMKSLSIDVNQYWALTSVLLAFDNLITDYCYAIILGIESEVNSQLNRVIHRLN